MPPPPELGDDILREVFLRLPSDDPACLLRASVACKRFRRIVADPAFRRRYRELHLHQTPSVAGLLLVTEVDAPYASRFVPHNAFGRPAARDFPGRLVLDCRHGRVLLVSASPSLGTQLNYDLVVWDPLTDEERCLPRPSPSPTVVCGGSDRHLNAAVLCAAPAEACCDHSECHGGPFRVVFVWSRGCGDSISLLTSLRVYSSETGDWSEPISVMHPSYVALDRMPCPSLLVGDTLYFRFAFMHVLEYELDRHCLSVTGGPPRSMMFESWDISLMSMEDGRLGCMDVEEDEAGFRLRLVPREAASDCYGVPKWTRGRAIELQKLLPHGALPSPRSASDPYIRIPIVQFVGFAEGTDVIFVGIRPPSHPHHCAVYMVQFNSGRARKVFDQYTTVIPYASFCIPVTDASSTTEGPGDDVSRARQSQAACSWGCESTRKRILMFASCVSDHLCSCCVRRLSA